MNIINVKNYQTLSEIAAAVIAAQIIKKPDSVLGLATGSTPEGTYKNLVEMYRDGILDFSKITTFNLDEYCGLGKEDPNGYFYFMMDKLFSHVNIPRENINVPDGTAGDVDYECVEYERKIRRANGIDLQLLGVGRNGHIGFCEPDEVFYNETRQVNLTESTIEANKRFFASAEEVPKTAISVGIKTIMSAREILVLAGQDKAEIVEKLKSNTCSPRIPASILHYHPNCTMIYAENA